MNKQEVGVGMSRHAWRATVVDLAAKKAETEVFDDWVSGRDWLVDAQLDQRQGDNNVASTLLADADPDTHVQFSWQGLEVRLNPAMKNGRYVMVD